MTISIEDPTGNMKNALLKLTLLAALTLPQAACVSAYVATVGGNSAKVFDRIYVTDYNTAWQATLDALKNIRLDVTNREGGFLQSKWTDNTAEKNLTDSFGSADSFLKAQFRFKVSVAKGFYNGTPTVKVSVQKEQMVQRDVLEGWRPVESDEIDETTLLYRIGRLIFIRTKIDRLEREKTKHELDNTHF
ncbi:MAG: hypothetical protein HYX41_00425 [Bdellovibrio sp.]|nr:hypothetical protein [Bdellovibrio sp.]